MGSHWVSIIRQRGGVLFNHIGSERIRRNILQALPFWIASLLTGLVAVGYTRLFALAEQGLQYVLHLSPWLLVVVSPCCFVAAWFLVQRFAPNARGSGIPQVMAAIDLAKPDRSASLRRLLSFRVALTKIGSSLLMVLGGGAIGREGPTIQIAGSIFSIIDRAVPKTWPKLSQQSFILTGAAAGLAAAFNTPLGGLVFAMEELAKVHVRFFRTALFSAVIIAGLTAQGLLGPYLYLGYPDVAGIKFSIFLSVALTAVLAGVLGAAMCKLILIIMEWKRRFSVLQTLMFVIGIGLVMALTAALVNKNILGSGKEIMNAVLFHADKQMSWDTLVVRVIGPALCFNTGGAGGIFAPALAGGASLGAFMAELVNEIGPNANLLILSGMVGFLTGVTRTPFTSAILVLEMTDRHTVIFHLLLAALLSNIAALLVDKHSFYEQLKEGYMPQGKNDAGNPPAPSLTTPR